MMRRVLAVVVFWWSASEGRLTCSRVMQEGRAEFHLVAPCSISGMTIIARTNTTSVKRCSQFANLKRGLAFNFKLAEKKRTTPENCLIYDCPESDTLQSIRREKDFDYYSLYANPLPSENSVCIVGVGMFRLHEERLNYTEAMRVCRDEGGELASALSFRRTNGLSDMVSELKHGREAYIGLNDIENEGKFVTMSGKLASCYEYRAWGLGEPRNRRQEEDCVTIDDSRKWKVVDCSKRLPFLCELLPKGPFPLPDEKTLDPCSINLANPPIAQHWNKIDGWKLYHLKGHIKHIRLVEAQLLMLDEGHKRRTDRDFQLKFWRFSSKALGNIPVKFEQNRRWSTWEPWSA